MREITDFTPGGLKRFMDGVLYDCKLARLKHRETGDTDTAIEFLEEYLSRLERAFGLLVAITNHNILCNKQ